MLRDTTPIVYERIGVFQQPMLRLIVQRLVHDREIYLPGELGAGRKPALPPPHRRFHVWCSRENPGASELIDELRLHGGWAGQLLVTDEPAQMDEADQLLLLLNRSTWANDDRKGLLAAQVRAPLERQPRRAARKEKALRLLASSARPSSRYALPPARLPYEMYPVTFSSTSTARP